MQFSLAILIGNYMASMNTIDFKKINYLSAKTVPKNAEIEILMRIK